MKTPMFTSFDKNKHENSNVYIFIYRKKMTVAKKT